MAFLEIDEPGPIAKIIAALTGKTLNVGTVNATNPITTPAATAATHAATKAQLDAAAATLLPRDGSAAMSGNLSFSKNSPQILATDLATGRIMQILNVGSQIYIREQGGQQVFVIDMPTNEVRMAGADAVTVPPPTADTHAATKTYVDAQRASRLFVSADELVLGGTATGLTRTQVGGRSVIEMFNGNTNTCSAVLDPVAQGIDHWSSYTPSFVFAPTTTDLGNVRMRYGPVTLDTDGADLSVPLPTTGGGATASAMPGVASQQVTDTASSALTLPLPDGLWRFPFDRNGANVNDTHDQAVQLLGIILNQSS